MENNLSLWQKYKKNLGDSRPWDLFNTNEPKVSDEVATARLTACNDCPHLIKLTQQCKKCGCFMHLKVKLAEASCPIGTWDKDKPEE